MGSVFPKVFVIMPFSEDYLALFEELKRVFGSDYEFINAGDLDNQQNILQDIVEGINSAHVVIADLTGLNANVFYELGLAHAMNKKVIIITQDIGELPFDIKSYRANEYSLQFNKLPDLIKKLKKLLSGAIDNTVKYGNPVADYLPGYYQEKSEILVSTGSNEIISDNNVSSEEEPTVDAKSDEMGLLDYKADIEDNTEYLSNELIEMTEELQDVTSAINVAVDDINRVKVKGGGANASYIRSVCRKLASPIEEFATKLHTHTQKISHIWSIIENSYLSLLDSKHTQTKSNLSSIKSSIGSLNSVQKGIIVSNEQFKGLIIAAHGNYGIERNLNKAISSLEIELEEYLSATETMYASIDRITAISKKVIDIIESK